MHRRHESTPWIPLLLSLPALLLTTASPARAESAAHLAAELELGAPLTGSGTFAVGGGGRFGYRIDFGPVWLQPEVAGHYVAFLAGACEPPCTSPGGAHVGRILGGARLGGAGLVSKVIEPALFGHAGYGWLSSTRKGPAFDVGLAIDVVVVPRFRFGAHGAYNVVDDQLGVPTSLGTIESLPAVKWLSFGLHAAVTF